MINTTRFTIKSPKTLIAATFFSLFSTSMVYAHDTCDVDLEAGLTINESSIEFFDPDQKQQVLYTIDNDHQLTVRGEKISLNEAQQALVTEFSASIRAMVPQVRNVAIEGVDLALDGVNLAFNELLGEGNDVGATLTQELSAIKEDVLTQFTIEHGFTIGENGLDNNELLGTELEQRIESSIEKAVMNSMGSLLVALGQEMMLSGGDSDPLEKRMESFGESIEQEMELRAKKIERKADTLCLAAIDIDQLEEALKASVEPLENINVITTKYISSDKDDKRAM